MAGLKKTLLFFAAILTGGLLFFFAKNAYASDILNLSASSASDQNPVNFVATVAQVDDSPVQRIEIVIDGSSLHACALPFLPGLPSCSATGGPYSAGQHTITGIVTDAGGTWSSSGNFNISTAGPPVPVEPPPPPPPPPSVCTPSNCPSEFCANTGQSRGCPGQFCPNNVGRECNDVNACTTGTTCNNSGSCGGGTSYSCSVTDCQISSVCDGAGGCTITNKPSGTACTADPNDCTNDVCNGSGSCTHPNSAAGTACSADTNQCTDDVCNGSGNCTHPYLRAGTNCSDNKSCTTQDVCNGKGACSGQVNCVNPPETQCHVTPGYCDPSGNCAYDSKTDGINCDSGVNCAAGQCSNGSCVSGSNVCGGLVPCGRLVDDPSTPWKENVPCQFCHIFVLMDNVIDFILLRVLFSLAVLMLVIIGLLYVGAVFGVLPGGFETFSKAKGMLTSLVLGIVIIFAAFVSAGVFLKLIGLADWTTNIYQNWWSDGIFQINCQVN